MKRILFCFLFTYLTPANFAVSDRFSSQIFVTLDADVILEDILPRSEKYFIIHPDDTNLSPEQNALLREKGKHVFAYLSLGYADNHRTYWEESWKTGSPSFIGEQNTDPGYEKYFQVNFWEPQWETTLLNFTQYRIVPFGFSGILLDYMGEYKKFLNKRPNAATEMVRLGKKIASFVKQQDPWMKVWLQDAVELYNVDNMKDVLDGVSVEGVFYDHIKNPNGTFTLTSRSADYATSKFSMLKVVQRHRKTILLEEFIEDPEDICSFYKECNHLGYICGVLDLYQSNVTRDCKYKRKIEG